LGGGTKKESGERGWEGTGPHIECYGRAVGQYEAPAVEIVSDGRSGDNRLIRLRLLQPERVTPPIAPASLVRSDPWESVLELHKLLNLTGQIATFATTDTRELPTTVEVMLRLQSWWTADAFELVVATNRSWRKGAFNDSTMPDYCPLCYRGLEEPEPVWIDDGGPICPECHSKYIVDDYLGVRHPPTDD
jgi:hypothetical protein